VTASAAHLLLCCLVVAGSGCAAKRDALADRFIKQGKPSVTLEPEHAVPVGELQTYMRKVRALQAKTTPKTSLLPTIEGQDRLLATALFRLSLMETAENHRLAAAAYRRAGVTDYAYVHYQQAIRLEPCDSAAYEGLAQIWRDWNMPDVALSDAYRALHCRPDSAAAYNTLGTVLAALGQTKNARRAFEQSLQLDGAASFALNNLCYLSLQERNGRLAEQECEQALARDPAMTAARTNLALAVAIQGDIPRAAIELRGNPDAAAGNYNVGMLMMSLGRYADAVQAFDAATAARPSAWDARRRAVQARAQLVAQKEP
jgi:Flp pilus assembly protein TadD